MKDALAEALKRLESSERTEAELRAALLRRHSLEETDAALAWLKSRDMLSETRAAESLVRPRTSGRRAEGNAKLRQRLASRGATPEAIEKALADAPEEERRMEEALAAKFSGDDPTARARAGRFLLSRGFAEDSVEGALDRFFGDV